MFKEKIRIQLLGGSLTDHGSYADGNYQGYPVVITTESTVYHVRINAVSTQDPDHKNAGSKRKQSSGYAQRCRRSSDSVSSWR